MDWDSLDWQRLERLRAYYLNPARMTGDYWESNADLEHYDATFGARIEWKWQAVCRELQQRGWRAKRPRVLDWGCGTGAASRAYLEFFPEVDSVDMWDRSSLAREYAATRLQASGFSGAVRGLNSLEGGYDLVLVSHVLNELSESNLSALKTLLRASGAVVWVEPGTALASQGLVEVRRSLKEQFKIVGPCTHQNNCGMSLPENSRHWCHSFAHPPSEIFADAGWALFSRKMGIDLRSLPYSYLALDSAADQNAGECRVIGETRHYKGYSKVQTCDGQRGVQEFILQKRDAPELVKRLKDLRDPPFFRFRYEGHKIVAEEESQE